jgi:hypothetical protein
MKKRTKVTDGLESQFKSDFLSRATLLLKQAASLVNQQRVVIKVWTHACRVLE